MIDDAGEGNVAGTQPNGGTSGSETGGSLGMGGEPNVGGMTGEAGASGEAGEGPVAGSGGGGGMAGSEGMAGSGGSAAGSGGTGGSGGNGGSGGSGGAATATGCAKLSVPLDATNDKAHFVISLNSNADMSAAKITMKYFVQAGTGGSIFSYVQDSSYHFLGVPSAAWTPIAKSSAWSTLTWDVGAEPIGSTQLVKTSIKRIGVEINAAPTSSGWANPTVVYIDSITVDTPALSFTFDTTDKVYVTPTNTDQGGLIWLNNVASDTTAAGSSIAWQASCP